MNATQTETRRVRTDALQTGTDQSPTKLTPILPAKPARVKPPYNPNPREQPDGTWLCDSERYGGFIQYMQWIDGDGGIHCNCTAGDFGKPCKHAASVHAQLHPPVVAEPAAPRMPRLEWQDCPRCGTTAWMPAGWECDCRPEPTPEPTRVVEVHQGWDYKRATDDVMAMYGW